MPSQLKKEGTLSKFGFRLFNFTLQVLRIRLLELGIGVSWLTQNPVESLFKFIRTQKIEQSIINSDVMTKKRPNTNSGNVKLYWIERVLNPKRNAWTRSAPQIQLTMQAKNRKILRIRKKNNRNAGKNHKIFHSRKTDTRTGTKRTDHSLNPPPQS